MFLVLAMTSLLAFELAADFQQEFLKLSPADRSGSGHKQRLGKHGHPDVDGLLRDNGRIPHLLIFVPTEFGQDGVDGVVLDEISEEHADELTKTFFCFGLVLAGGRDVERWGIGNDMRAFFDECNG